MDDTAPDPVYGRGLKTERSTGVRRGQTAQRTAERGATARDPANTARRRDRATETADPKEAGRLADTTPGARRRSGDQEDPGAPGRRPRRGDVVLCVRWRSQSATPGWATAARVRASATPCADGTTPDRAADDRPRGSLHRPYRPRVGTPFLGTGPAARRGRRPGQRLRESAMLHRRLRSRRRPTRDDRTRAPGTGSRYARPPTPAHRRSDRSLERPQRRTLFLNWLFEPNTPDEVVAPNRQAGRRLIPRCLATAQVS